jgi:hypothetical protein
MLSWKRVLASRCAPVVAFAAVAATTLARHEMWLDELNPWVIARDARSIGDLFFNMRFEPHPPLWYLCLYVLTRITGNPIAMQAFHGTVATASVVLIAYRSPFSRLQVWLLAFGYYLVFEYCAISRGYALGIFLALGVCTIASTDRPRPFIIIAVLLALLANTSIFGVFLVVALAVAIAPRLSGRRPAELALGVAIVLAGLGLSLWALTPSPENTFGQDKHLSFSTDRMDYIGSLLGAAYWPLPNFTAAAPWNTTLLVAGGRYVPYVGHFVPVTLGMIVLVFALVHLRRHPSLIAALALGSAAILALLYVEYSAGYRHAGHLFVLLLLMFWLAAVGTPRSRAPGWFTYLLATQVVAGVYFAALDYARPFSASKDLAEFFADKPPQIPIIVAQPDYLSYAGPPLSGYLEKRVYYAIHGGIVRGSYLWYDQRRVRGASEDEIVSEISRFAADRATDVYVVTSHWESARVGARVLDLPRDLIEGDERATAVHLFKKPG